MVVPEASRTSQPLLTNVRIGKTDLKENDMKTEKFEQWAVVELFGHQRIAGLVSEQVIGGCSFVRVDVPENGEAQGYTKLYGNGAIYAMTFVDEETGMAAAKQCSPKPIDEYSARRMLEMMPADRRFDGAEIEVETNDDFFSDD